MAQHVVVFAERFLYAWYALMLGGGGGVLATVGGLTFFFGDGSDDGRMRGDSSTEWLGLWRIQINCCEKLIGRTKTHGNIPIPT